MEMILYYFNVTRKPAQTGVTKTSENGPFVVSVLGGAHRHVSDEEALGYVRKMHGRDPDRMERVQT